MKKKNSKAPPKRKAANKSASKARAKTPPPGFGLKQKTKLPTLGGGMTGLGGTGGMGMSV